MRNQTGMGLFALALLSFILPWLDIRCGEQTLARFKGIELLTGKEMGSELGKSDPSLWVIGAAVLLVAGLLLYALKKPNAACVFGWLAPAALVGFVIQTQYDLNRRVSEEGTGSPDVSGMITAEYQVGFYLCLLLSVAAAAVPGVMERWGAGKPTSAPTAPPPSTPT